MVIIYYFTVEITMSTEYIGVIMCISKNYYNVIDGLVGILGVLS